VSSVVDRDTQAKIDVVKQRLIKNFGYDEVSATDVLNFVASIFARVTSSRDRSARMGGVHRRAQPHAGRAPRPAVRGARDRRRDRRPVGALGLLEMVQRTKRQGGRSAS